MLHVWNIYLQNWVIFRANVGKYSIHGAYGMDIVPTKVGISAGPFNQEMGFSSGLPMEVELNYVKFHSCNVPGP